MSSSAVWVRRLTDDKASDFWPVWAKDGKRIAFTSYRGSGPVVNLHWKAADGTGTEERLSESPFNQRPKAWFDGGATLIGDLDGNPQTGWDIFRLTMGASPHEEALIQTPATEKNPELSPDGRWIAYSSNQTGGMQVYVRRYPGLSELSQVSVAGGNEPAWSPDGRTIYYRDPSGRQMWSVAFDPDGETRLGKPTLLFEIDNPYTLQFGRQYDVSPDGRGFVTIVEEAQPEPATRINVILNWTEELRRLVSDEESPKP